MGWFWQSSSPDSSSPPSGPSSTTPSQTTSTTPTTMAPPPSAAPRSVDPPTTTTTPSTDREVEKFWSMLVEESQTAKPAATPPPPTETTTTTPPPPPAPSTPWMGWAGLPSSSPPPGTTAPSAQPTKPRSPQSAALSDASLPQYISCRDAFDYAWHCHTPASQFNSIYRYGSVRSCSELWDDFWFCMRVKSYPPDLKADAIKEHYRAKEVAKYYAAPDQPSSEDVWESRDEKVAPGTAFTASFDAPVDNDAEFQRKDAERRRAIRREVGFVDDEGRKKE